VAGGKCAGLSYRIEWDDLPPKESDHQFIFEEEIILIDKKSIVFLNGSTLDFEKTLMKSGFKFINPQEGASCGCGVSWSLKNG
jgi:iron-sulfur cluster assembly protein